MTARPSHLLALPSYLAGKVAKLAQEPVRELLAEDDLQLPHYAVLAALADFGPASQQEIAERLELDKSHMVRFVDLLEQRGFVRRAACEEDRRRYSVTLTPAGRRLIRRIDPQARAAQRERLGVLSAHEQQQLATLLQRVLQAYDDERLDPRP